MTINVSSQSANHTYLGNFRKDIRNNTRESNWSNPQFSGLAEELYSSFRGVRFNKQEADAETVSAFFELVRMDWGVSAVVKTANELAGSSTRLEPIASALLSSCQAGSGHELAVQPLELFRASEPDNPIIALRLGQALAGIGDWESLDRLASDTVHSLDYGPWALERWARLLTDSCRFEVAEQFVSKLDSKPDLRRLLDLRLQSFTEGTGAFPFPTYLINLDREPRKLRLSMELLQHGGYSPTRVSAIDGKQLPEFALEKLGSSPKVLNAQGAGAIATALSHIKTWEQFLSSNADVILVVEDDAAPYVHWSFHRELLERALLPDLLWANERMSFVSASNVDISRGLEKPWSALGEPTAQYNGIGTDCYLLTRNGAEKLLDFFRVDGIQRHIDWQMGSYSIGRSAGNPTTSRQTVAFNNRREVNDNHEIDSFCLKLPLITASDHGVSNTTDISREYRQRG